MIESRNDVDVFSFSAPAGQLEITVTPAWAAFYRTSSRGANLDIQAVLLDSTGKTDCQRPIRSTDTNAVISTTVAGRDLLPAGRRGGQRERALQRLRQPRAVLHLRHPRRRRRAQ